MIVSDIGIVILNFNTAADTKNCINNISRFCHDSLHVVVVDNCSTDNSYEILNKVVSSLVNFDLIKTDLNGGYSCGNNQGIRYLINKHPGIKYIGIINPDVEIADSDIFKNLAYKLENDPNLAGISPLMILDNSFKPERFAIKQPKYIYNFISSFTSLKKINPLLYRSYNIIPSRMTAYVDVIPGSFILFRKDILTGINLFDENVFLYGEEIIIGKKVNNLNKKLGISFSNYYVHNHQDLKSSFLHQILHLKYSLRSHLYYNKKYNNRFWGSVDSTLVIIFLPFRVMEMFMIRLLLKRRNKHVAG